MIAHQKILRDKYIGIDEIPPISLEVKNAEIKPISYQQAKEIILKYEWLQTMSKTRWHYGIYFGDYLAGVNCFGINCVGGTQVPKQFGLNYDELIYLARGACVSWAPKNTNSRLTSQSIKLLKQEYPKAKLIIAYADSEAGEIGTIYQACNWFYVGKTSGKRRWISPSGREYDERLPGNMRSKDSNKYEWAYYKQKLLDEGYTTRYSKPKCKYVFPLDSFIEEKIKGMALPYPKRDIVCDFTAVSNSI